MVKNLPKDLFEVSNEELESSNKSAVLINSGYKYNITEFVDLKNIDKEIELIKSILIIDPSDYLSFNINLPYTSSENKRSSLGIKNKSRENISKLIGFEIQDLVPFDTEEFLLSYGLNSSNNLKSTNANVNIIGKQNIRTNLQMCKSLGIEPHIITTSINLLSIASLLSQTNLESNINCILLYANNDQMYLSAIVNRTQISNRIINNPDSIEEVTKEIFKSIKYLEDKFSTTFDVVYALNFSKNLDYISSKIKKEVRFFDIKSHLTSNNDFSPNSVEKINNYSNTEILIPTLSSFVFSNIRNTPVVNFRVNEFKFNPHLKILIKYLKELSPYLFTFIVVVIISLSCIYVARDIKLKSLKLLAILRN